jgi:hypothetical protein
VIRFLKALLLSVRRTETICRSTCRCGEHVEQQCSFSKALVLSVRRTEVICRSTCRYGEHVEQQRCYFSSKALPSQAICSSKALPSLAREFCYFSSTFFYFLFLVQRTETICRSTCRKRTCRTADY